MIRDVELRYVTRTSYTKSGQLYTGLKTILQYRKRIVVKKPNDDDKPIVFLAWSDWEDVPFAAEEKK